MTYRVSQLAERWSVKPHIVYQLIDSGALEAINVATNPLGKPSWRITEDAVRQFETSRTKRTHKTTKKRAKAPSKVIEFF